MSDVVVENSGSTARDFCMLERNLLSHLKLALLLSLLSSAVLLKARLVPDPDDEQSRAGIPIAAIQFAGAVIAIIAGSVEYTSGCRDLMSSRFFLAGTKNHLALITVVVGIVLTSCVIALAEE